jgi:hypothetical protein
MQCSVSCTNRCYDRDVDGACHQGRTTNARQAANPLVARGARDTLIEFYTALPAHKNFAKVKRSGFTAKTPTICGSRGSKDRKHNPDEVLAGVAMDEPPSSDGEAGPVRCGHLPPILHLPMTCMADLTSGMDRVSGKRVTKERREYIEYKEGEVVQCARLEHILVHEATQGKHNICNPCCCR